MHDARVTLRAASIGAVPEVYREGGARIPLSDRAAWLFAREIDRGLYLADPDDLLGEWAAARELEAAGLLIRRADKDGGTYHAYDVVYAEWE